VAARKAYILKEKQGLYFLGSKKIASDNIAVARLLAFLPGRGI
jgi:hypothetical protein